MVPLRNRSRERLLRPLPRARERDESWLKMIENKQQGRFPLFYSPHKRDQSLSVLRIFILELLLVPFVMGYSSRQNDGGGDTEEHQPPETPAGNGEAQPLKSFRDEVGPGDVLEEAPMGNLVALLAGFPQPSEDGIRLVVPVEAEDENGDANNEAGINEPRLRQGVEAADHAGHQETHDICHAHSEDGHHEREGRGGIADEEGVDKRPVGVVDSKQEGKDLVGKGAEGNGIRDRGEEEEVAEPEEAGGLHDDLGQMGES